MVRYLSAESHIHDRTALQREINRGRVAVIGRFAWLAAALAAVFAAWNLLGDQVYPGELGSMFLAAHVTMAAVSAAAGLTIYLFRASSQADAAEPTVVLVAAAVAVAAAAAYSIAIATIDSFATGTGASYVLIIVAIGYVTSLRPVWGIAIFGVIHTGFVFAILQVQDNAALRYQALLDGSVAVVVAAYISFINHRRRTARVRVQLGLQVANAQKDRLISLIAHDLRSPLAALNQSARVLVERAPQMGAQDKQAITEAMTQTASTAISLLDRLIQWARAGSRALRAAPESFPIGPLVTESLALLAGDAQRKGITLEYDVNPEARVTADRDMVQAVLRNLVSNAIKFSSAGGRVSISSGTDGQFTALSVADTGTGMTAEELDSIVGPGPIRSRSGTQGERGSGIGLQIVRDLVAMNDGELVIETEAGRGTVATLLLPQPGKSGRIQPAAR